MTHFFHDNYMNKVKFSVISFDILKNINTKIIKKENRKTKEEKKNKKLKQFKNKKANNKFK